MWTFNFFVVAGLTFIRAQDISFDGCNKTSVCVKTPGCTTPQNCRALAMYNYNSTTNRVHFKLFFKTKWAAFAQNTFKIDENRMVNAKGFACIYPVPLSATKTEPSALRFILTSGLGSPAYVGPAEIADISDVELSTIGGVHMCSFSRPIEVNTIEGGKYLYNLDLSTDLVNIIVMGEELAGTELDYHGSSNFYVDESKPVTNWKSFTAVVVDPIQPSASEMMPSSSASKMASIYDNSMRMDRMSVSDGVSMATDGMMSSESVRTSQSKSIMMEMSNMVSTTPDFGMSSKSMMNSVSPAMESPKIQATSSSIIDVMSSQTTTTTTTTTTPPQTTRGTTDKNGIDLSKGHATTCTASISLLVVTVSAFIMAML